MYLYDISDKTWSISQTTFKMPLLPGKKYLHYSVSICWLQYYIERLVDKMDKTQLCKEVLLMPIECNKNHAKIMRCCDIIQTGQKYYSSADEDMSDFSIRFYEIIYRDLLNYLGLSTLLSDAGYLRCNQLAGDTMNSFNTTANRTPGAGISRKSRTPECQWPKYLCDYYHNYHCLANFWLLPMEVGRTARGHLNKAKKPVNDYMDNFLEMMQINVRFDESEGCFYRFFKDWDGFIDRHFIRRAYLNEDKIERYSDSDSEGFIETAFKRIEKRAEDIAESEYAAELVELFITLGIV